MTAYVLGNDDFSYLPGSIIFTPQPSVTSQSVMNNICGDVQ